MATRIASVCVLVLAGCSGQSPESVSRPQEATARPATSVEDGRRGTLRPTAGVRANRASSAPDRGELLSYQDSRARHRGIHAWHPAGFSEEHALRAIVSGRMRVPAPDGTSIALEYAGHVEHQDGHWTWVGQNAEAPGETAAVTFGPDAVLGIVPQGRGLPPLRLVVVDGTGWVVSTEGSRDPAFLAASVPGAGIRTKARMQSAGVFADAPASRRGRRSVAITLAHHLADLGKPVRATRTMSCSELPCLGAATSSSAAVAAGPVRVPKGDADASGTTDLMWFKPGATELLPGTLDIWLMSGHVVAGTASYPVGPVAPDWKLHPYVEGAFNFTPGRDIAWRNGMGTLIYWMGGPAYTRAPYEAMGLSFGWRLQASGDRNGDGISDLYWRSAVDGRLMYWELDAVWESGAYQAYRAFPQSPGADLLMVGDFNGDGLSELFFRTRATGATQMWLPDGADYTVVPRGRMSKYWRPAGAGDYDGDGDDDLVWRSAIDHRVLVWIMENAVRAGVVVFDSDSERQLLGVGYLDTDRRLDLVWRRSDGAVSAWLNTGNGFQHRYIGNRDSSWTLFVGGR